MDVVAPTTDGRTLEAPQGILGTDGTVSVVIPTHNRRELLPAVVAPLLSDPATLEVIVVVDGCQDGSLELLQGWARSERKLKPIWQENAGEGAARATGLAAAAGDIVLFVDDDVVAEPGLVTGHMRVHQGGASRLVVGYMPPVLSAPRRPGQVATYIYARDYEGVCRAYEEDPQQVLLNLWAGNVSLSRETALTVGVAGSPKIGYHADKQFGYRCAVAGMNGHFARTLVARHHHQRSVEQFRDELRRQVAARSVLAAENGETDSDAWLIWKPSGTSAVILRILSSSAVYGRFAAAALGTMRIAGRMRLWGLETSMLRVIRQVDLYRHLYS